LAYNIITIVIIIIVIIITISCPMYAVFDASTGKLLEHLHTDNLVDIHPVSSWRLLCFQCTHRHEEVCFRLWLKAVGVMHASMADALQDRSVM
jgi:hypothetical protein